MDSQLNRMLGNTHKTRWASPSDWQAQKQRIVDLYKHHTLREVMRMMRETYDFHATIKMYKAHLRQWGIRKNLEATQVQRFLEKESLEDQEKASELLIGGVRADQQKIKNYIRRAKKPRNGGIRSPSTSQLTVSNQTATLEQMFLHSYQPEFEKILYAMRNYVSANFDSGRWTEARLPWHGDLMVSAHNSVWSAGRLLNSGHTTQAFRVLNICLDSTKVLMASAAPSFPLGIYAVLFEFSKRNEALTRCIMLFGRDLALLTYGSSQHPIYIMFDTMSRMTPQKLCDCAWALAAGYHSVLSTELRHKGSSAYAEQLATMNGRNISWGAAHASVEDYTAERALREHAYGLSASGQSTIEALEARVRIANFLLDRKRYSEARHIAEEVMSPALCGGAAAEYAYLLDDCYRILFWVSASSHQGSREGAIAAAGRWVTFCKTQLGRSHELTVDALGEVAEWLENNGDSEAAGDACRAYEAAIDDMCERLAQVGLEGDVCAPQKKTMLYGRTAQQGSVSQ